MGVHRRQPATRAEARALAHPLRLRIMRLAKDEELTVSQLAQLLERDKATVLHHVRTLAQQGFLVEAQPRRSASGRPEKPYRATRKALTVALVDTPELPAVVLEAYQQEIAGHEDPSPAVVRRPLRLDGAGQEEFLARLRALVDEFDTRADPQAGTLNFVAIAVRTRS